MFFSRLTTTWSLALFALSSSISCTPLPNPSPEDPQPPPSATGDGGDADPFRFEGGYWRPKPGSVDITKAGIGGTQSVPGAAQMKADLTTGVYRTMYAYKSQLEAWGMGVDPSLAQQVIAEATFETSMGKWWPTKEDQTKETNPDIPYTKWGTLSQEIGCMRMNRDMLLSLNYTETDIDLLNSRTSAGNQLNGEAWVKGLVMYGETGFYMFHRGGRGRLDAYRQGRLSDKDMDDTIKFRRGIWSYQYTMILYDYGTNTDVVPWASNNVPWI